jgi:tetratricopeptide (TPR) repeat protein
MLWNGRKLEWLIAVPAVVAFVYLTATDAQAQVDKGGVRVLQPGPRVPKSPRTIAPFQRDPIRLVKEFSLNRTTGPLAFDLALTVEQTLGSGAWEKLNDQQRAVVKAAYEQTVKEVLEEWDQDSGDIRVLKSEIDGRLASVTVLRELDMRRMRLASRSGAWFITEHEIVDDGLPEFADAIQGALHPGTGLGQVYEMPDKSAQKYLENLIAKKGESPELLLLKYRLLVSRRLDEMNAKQQLEKTTGATAAEPKQGETREDRGLKILEEITRRWPDFAPGHLALATDLLYVDNDDSGINGMSKDTERAVEPLKRYIELVSYDPRPWRDLANAYELLEKPGEAEAAHHSAIKRDPTYLDHRAMLIDFYLGYDQIEKAVANFAEILKLAADADEAFESLDIEEGFDPDYASALEELLLNYQKELESSKEGLVLLARAQEGQNKTTDAVKTMQRAVAINAEREDYKFLSQLYRQQRRYTEALYAANQALKLDGKFAIAYFERACSLTQLGRKREALASLRQMISLDGDSSFDPDEPDLQPLVNMPEFKALKEKLVEKSKNAKP